MYTPTYWRQNWFVYLAYRDYYDTWHLSLYNKYIIRIALRKYFTKVLLGEFVHAYYYRCTRDTLHILNITAVVEPYVATSTVYLKEFVKYNRYTILL